MFGLKWLWKTNRGSNIDTSNFVSKEFLNTTLQDYVNRDLLNTTLSNELANYVSTNTAQTISGAKTFTEGIVINKTPVPLTLKATDNNKTYIVYKDSSNNSNLSLGANSAQTSLEVNRGDLLIQTQQNNKTVSFETGVIKTNRARVEFGTEINAGYGGGAVKFIPEDNSTKTLQFYNSAATDTRRFNLLVPEPTAAQNPATKNYVDNAIAGVSNTVRYQDLTITGFGPSQIMGIFTVYSITARYGNNEVFLGASIHYPREVFTRYYEFDYYFTSNPNTIYFVFRKQTSVDWELPPLDTTFIRIFYISNSNTLNERPFTLVERGGN